VFHPLSERVFGLGLGVAAACFFTVELPAEVTASLVAAVPRSRDGMLHALHCIWASRISVYRALCCAFSILRPASSRFSLFNSG
jgi:hypothetical protein